jgi:hypothetical protein
LAGERLPENCRRIRVPGVRTLAGDNKARWLLGVCAKGSFGHFSDLKQVTAIEQFIARIRTTVPSHLQEGRGHYHPKKSAWRKQSNRGDKERCSGRCGIEWRIANDHGRLNSFEIGTP